MKLGSQKEIPVGLAMSLALNEFAMEYYSELDEKTRDKITHYVQGGSTGREAKDRINHVIQDLAEKNTHFLE